MNSGLNNTKEDQLKLVICTPQVTKPPVLESFLQGLKANTNFIRVEAQKFSEVYDHISGDVGAMVLISILVKEDLPEVLHLLGRLEPRLTNGTHKIVVYNQVNNDKLVSLLRSKGVSEVLENNVSLKAFQYKFNKVTQLLEQSIKRAKEGQKGKQANGQSNSTVSSKTKKNTGQVVYTDSIEHFSDFWLLMNQKNVRFVIGKWFVNFYGPGPSYGTWESYPETKNGEQGWVYTPRKADSKTFYQDEGRWVFFGNCPEFSWEEKNWYFISKVPELSFFQDKKVVHTKVKILEGGDLQFCKNSKAGMNLQGEIDESIEASIRLNDSTKVKKSQESFDAEKALRGKDFREEKPVEKEYKGRFSEEFEERKKKYNKNYDCSKLSLGLVSKNGKPTPDKNMIELIELREKYVVLDVEAGLLAVDDLIELEALITEGGIEKKITISAATQIVETETQEAGGEKGVNLRSVAICELNEKIAPQFSELVQSFKSRREEMTDFFTKAKGVA